MRKIMQNMKEEFNRSKFWKNQIEIVNEKLNKSNNKISWKPYSRLDQIEQIDCIRDCRQGR
jgi:hypothetical protein